MEQCTSTGVPRKGFRASRHSGPLAKSVLWCVAAEIEISPTNADRTNMLLIPVIPCNSTAISSLWHDCRRLKLRKRTALVLIAILSKDSVRTAICFTHLLGAATTGRIGIAPTLPRKKSWSGNYFVFGIPTERSPLPPLPPAWSRPPLRFHFHRDDVRLYCWGITQRLGSKISCYADCTLNLVGQRGEFGVPHRGGVSCASPSSW